MSRQCEICGKTPIKANKVCFSHKHHAYRQKPNLQSMKVTVKGCVKSIKACTSCIKANKVAKAV
jgi:large subunit ribosomal protein L28